MNHKNTHLYEICDECNEPVIEPGSPDTICGSCAKEIEKELSYAHQG